MRVGALLAVTQAQGKFSFLGRLAADHGTASFQADEEMAYRNRSDRVVCDHIVEDDLNELPGGMSAHGGKNERHAELFTISPLFIITTYSTGRPIAIDSLAGTKCYIGSFAAHA